MRRGRGAHGPPHRLRARAVPGRPGPPRLEGYFRQIIFVQELGLEKRNPEAFTRSLALLGAEAGDCTLFEDSPGACRAAQAVGIRAVGVFDPFYASYEAEMRGFCDRYITSFTELL